MSGHSGSAVAPHTPIATVPGGPSLTISGAQASLLRAAMDSGGRLIVSKNEERSAGVLVSLRLARWVGEREIELVGDVVLRGGGRR